MSRVGAAVSGLGLETAPVAAPTLMQPLPQRVDRLGHKTPPMPQLFFVVIAFLQKIIMIQLTRQLGNVTLSSYTLCR